MDIRSATDLYRELREHGSIQLLGSYYDTLGDGFDRDLSRLAAGDGYELEFWWHDDITEEVYWLRAQLVPVSGALGGPQLQGVMEDYLTLLRDGVVGFTLVERTDESFERELRQWKSVLIRRAEADGLRVALFWACVSTVAADPYLALLGSDGAMIRLPPNYPYDQQAAAAAHRHRAEAEWGDTLARARERARI